LKADQRRWDERFQGKEFTFGKRANTFLREHIHLLPKGRALDLATGEGRNALFLAKHGWEVDAVDISPVGLRRTRNLAKKAGVKIRTIRADLDTFKIKREHYDLIANLYFLNRRLIPRMKRGLKRGGSLIFETYTIDQRTLGTGGPKHIRYFLKHNELLERFKDFRVLFYREGIFKEGGKRRAVASLIAEKS
jgi:tellurite methyltransferase